MKKLASICLAALLLFALTLPAAADVIWEPLDSFYEAHRDECTYVEYRYEAQRETHYYLEPDVPSEQEPLPAGTVILVNYLWKDGAWGSTTDWELYSGGVAGNGDFWVDLADFRRLYGQSDFANDHRKEFVEEPGSVPVEGTVYLWSFPGSGENLSLGEEGWGQDEEIGYDQVYTDEGGLQWGRVGYYFGIRDYWLCLSDLSNPDLPVTAPRYADEAASAQQTPPADDPVTSEQPQTDAPTKPSGTETEPVAQRDVIPAGTEQTQSAQSRLLLPVIGLVAAVVAVTAVLLLVLKKRSRKEP